MVDGDNMEESEALISRLKMEDENSNTEWEPLKNISSTTPTFNKDSNQSYLYTIWYLIQSDRWWAWVVLGSSFLCLCVLDGISYTFGMFLGPLMEELKCGRSGVSAAGSLQVGVYSISGIFASRLVTRYGSRPVCITGALISSLGLISASYSWNLPSLLATYSIVTGIGFGLMYIPAVVAVAEHFSKRRSLAMGICVCGTGVGTFLLAPAELSLLTDVGWRWTFVCMGGLCSLCSICGATMSPVTDDLAIGETHTRKRKTTVVSIHGAMLDDLQMSTESLQNEKQCFYSFMSKIISEKLLESPALHTYMYIALADGVATLALFLPFTYLPDLAVVSGVSSNDAAFLISAAGISSSVGRILSGWLCDQHWCNPIVVTMAAVAAAALPCLLLPYVTLYSLFLLFSCMFGLLTGIWISATSPLLVRVVGLPLLSPAFGLMTAVQGAAALAGPPLAGAVTDWLDDRTVPLYCTSGLMLAATVLFVVGYCHNRNRERRSYYQEIY